MENTIELAPRFRELFDICTVEQMESAIINIPNSNSASLNEVLKIALEKRPG
jgi:hypothetical protein